VLANPTLSRALLPFLPPDLPTPANEAALARAISSPQFRAAVASLDRALRTGLLGDLVRGLGLPAEAGLGVEAFLSAIEQQARGGSGTDGGDGDGEGRMDTN
jgi:26S proteasome regulatory subunit N13